MDDDSPSVTSSDSDDEVDQGNTFSTGVNPVNAINGGLVGSSEPEAANSLEANGIDTAGSTPASTPSTTAEFTEKKVDESSLAQADVKAPPAESTEASAPAAASTAADGVNSNVTAPSVPDSTIRNDAPNGNGAAPSSAVDQAPASSSSGAGAASGAGEPVSAPSSQNGQENGGESESKEDSVTGDAEHKVDSYQGEDGYSGGKQLPPPDPAANGAEPAATGSVAEGSSGADGGTASSAVSSAAGSADATVSGEGASAGDAAFKLDPQRWGSKDEKEAEHTEVWVGDKINFYWGPSIGWVVGTVSRHASSMELRVKVDGATQVKTSAWLVDFADGDQMICELDMSTRGQVQGVHHWYFVAKAAFKSASAPPASAPPASAPPAAARARPSISDPTPNSSSSVVVPVTSDKFGGMGLGPELKYFNKGKAKKGDKVSIHSATGEKVGMGQLMQRSEQNPAVVEVLVDAPGFTSQGLEYGPEKALKTIKLHPSFLLPLRDKKGGSKKRKAGGGSGAKGKDKRAKSEPPDKFGGLGAGPDLRYFDKKKVCRGHHVSIHKQDSAKVGTGVIDCRVLSNPALVEVVVDTPGFLSQGIKFGPSDTDTTRIHLHPSFLLLLKN